MAHTSTSERHLSYHTVRVVLDFTSLFAVLSTVLFTVLWSVQTIPCMAQCNRSDQIETATYYAVVDGEIDSTISIPPHDILPYYLFVSHQEHAMIRMHLGEITVGSARITFDNWCKDSVHALEENLESRSTSFAVQTGDTIRMYRDFYWLDQTTHKVDPLNLRLDGEVRAIIDVVDENLGSRIAVLDSIIFTTNDQTGSCIISAYPPVQQITYVLPPDFTGVRSMYIRIILSDRAWMRTDVLQARLSTQRLADPHWRDYAQTVMQQMICNHR